MRFRRAYLLLVIALIAWPRSALTESPPAVVVIVHPSSSVDRLDRKFVESVFLKKRTRWSDDSTIRPVDLKPGSAVRRQFSENVIGRSVDTVRRYWNQLVFSGRGVPPPALDSEADVVMYVTKHAGAIGYVSGAIDLKGARVVQVR